MDLVIERKVMVEVKACKSLLSELSEKNAYSMTVSRTAQELVRELERTRDETLGYYSLRDTELARAYGEGKWSVKFILHHLADSEQILYERIGRTIAEPRPNIMVFQESLWAKHLDYATLPLEISRRVYEAVREAHVYYARKFYESHGHLEFVHSEMGVRTLRQEFDKVADHNEHHLAQIRLALSRS